MDFNGYREGNVYSASIYKGALSTNGPSDLFGIYASTGAAAGGGITRVEILSVNLSFSSSAVSQTPQSLSLQFLSGSTASSTTAAIVPTNLRRWAGAPTAGSSVTSNSSGLVSTASAVQIWAEAVNTALGYYFPPYQEMTGLVRPVVASGQRLHIRLDTPQVALVFSGTLTFREIGGGNAA